MQPRELYIYSLGMFQSEVCGASVDYNVMIKGLTPLESNIKFCNCVSVSAGLSTECFEKYVISLGLCWLVRKPLLVDNAFRHACTCITYMYIHVEDLLHIRTYM